jgi:hypothetical protein
MNWTRIENEWGELQNRFGERWARLTAEHLSFIDGDKERMRTVLQRLYCRDADEISREIDDWLNSDAFEDIGQTPEAIRSSH